MKKRKTIEIDGKEFELSELTVKQIIDIFDNSKFVIGLNELTNSDNISLSIVRSANEINNLLAQCANFRIEDLMDLTPSEIKLVFDVFKEVNSDFLSILESLGMIETFQRILKEGRTNFLEHVVSSSKTDIAQF